MPTAGRPGTGAGGQPIGAPKIADRPMTKQGLSRMGTAGVKSSYGRVIQDESYFVGALRRKNSELQAEITNIRGEITKLTRDHDQYQSYEKRAKALSGQIKEMQGDLADLNMLEDQIQQHVSIEDVLQDADELRLANDEMSNENDALFSERSKIEALVKQTAAQIVDEKGKAERLVEEFDPEQRDAYYQLTEQTEQMQATVGQMQDELGGLEQQIADCEGELSRNPIKREAVNLHKTIADRKEKRDKLKADMEADDMGTPEEQQARLLNNVKEDNQAIAAMEKRIVEIGNRVDEIQSEIADMEDETDDPGSEEKRRKYQQLLERDQDMDKFFARAPGEREAEMARLAEVEDRIQVTLEQISDDLARSGNLPDIKKVEEEKKMLGHRQRQLDNSQSTAKSLDERRARLQKDLGNVNQLENKIASEMEQLNGNIQKWEQDLTLYEDIGMLKTSTEVKKRQLLLTRTRLLQRRDTSKRLTEQMAEQYERVNDQLQKNETFTQLEALEKKWRKEEQVNHGHNLFILSKETESNFKPYVKEVVAVMKEYNNELKKREPVKLVSTAM